MKEIKFKAWDKLANTMRLVKSINYADDGFAETIMVYLVGGKECGYVHGESCELLRYTGLKDSKGNEIYEGDILRCKRRNIDKALGYGRGDDYIIYTKVIKFDNQSFNVPQGFVKEIEVIGNIYKNPELISN